MHGLMRPRRTTSARTRRSNLALPSLRGRAKSPLSRRINTVSAATQVIDLNGCCAVGSAAGHTHSSRSRTC